MADSAKGNSSTGEAKAKKSLLDDDFSKDFLSSWKSSGDDMDFNFEPVSKGKKKAFEFGMDMDFSLDDAFGKMSSFKMDMDDLDFSSSPKKPAKSKDKSEEDSAKGNRSDKHDKFSFSFDFNGLDDFNLDVPPNKKGKSPNTEKKNSECEDLPKQVTVDKRKAVEDIICNSVSVCEDAPSSKSEDLVIRKYGPDNNSENCATESTLLTPPIQPETLISSDKKFAENIEKNDHQSYKDEETYSKKLSSPGEEDYLDRDHISKPTQSINLPMVVESVELHMNTDDDMQLKEDTTSNQPHTQMEEMDVSVNIPSDEVSTQANILEEVRINPPNREVKNGSPEGGNLMGEVPAEVVLTSDTDKLVVDKSSLQCSIEKMNISDNNNELGNGGCLGSAKLPLGTGKPSVVNDTNALPSSARPTAGVQKPAKVSSMLFGSGSNATNTILLRNNVPRATSSKLPALQAKNDGRAGSSALKDNGIGSTNVGSLDKSYGNSKHSGMISDDNRSSLSKDIIKKDAALEKIEKNPSAHATSRNDVSADPRQHIGKSAKYGLPSLESEKLINNVKSSGSEISSTQSEQGTKISNQGQGEPKNKISSIASIPKLNIGLENKLSSQRIDKKMPAFPSLKLTRNTISEKLPVPPNVQGYVKSVGESEKSSRLQASIKIFSPVSAKKQTPSTPSLKRKPSEAADMDPANLRMPKRASPSEQRISNVSSRDLKDEVQVQKIFLEGSGKNVTPECLTPKFNLDQEANMEALQFSLMVDNDANVEKAEACAKELDNICNMLKKKHEEAKELLVRALVNNNNLLMLNHPIYDEKIRAVQRFASRLMSKEQEVEA